MSPRHLSFYLTLFGAAHRGRLGAWAWTLCGFGYFGIVWQRLSGAQISRTNDWSAVTKEGVLSHLPQLVLGVYRLERNR